MKRLLANITALGVISLFLTGCASTLRQPLTEDNIKRANTITMTVATSQREIKPLVALAHPPTATAPSNAAVGATLVGGILGGLIITAIDHATIKHAERDMAPIRSMLDNFHFFNILTSDLRAKLLPLHRLKIDNTNYKFGFNQEKREALIKHSGKNSILYIDIQYGLNNTFNLLQVVACADLQHHNASKRHETESLYSECVSTVDQLNLKNPSRQASTAMWTAHHGRLIKSTLTNASAHIATMLALDIVNPNSGLYEKSNGTRIHFNQQMLDGNEGKVITRLKNSGAIVRSSDGTLYALNKYAIEK